MQPDFLQALNEVQLKAATYPANGCLQILAGPGSGKTRVLTARIAHLIVNCRLPPASICAVTFTNKAANEMKERLTKLIGKNKTAQLKMGTFHSLCARFLTKYSKEAKVPDNFTVCDASESKKLISHILRGYADEIKAGFSLEPAACASLISKAKSRGQSAKDYLAEALAVMGARESDPPGSLEVIVGKVYVGYEAALRRINALDFDDLLIYGVKLFTTHEECVLWCRHILVDEFQDTNVTQYQLMYSIGSARCVTIVGDPDQSIYGWRSAEVKNLEKMRRDFPSTTQIFLEENYRSTASILEASLAIVSQDSKRINKSLFTSHPEGVAPVLYQVNDEGDESRFIAIEIKRMVASMGGTFSWGDFAILLRYNALSRGIERALQNERIPCRILGGHKFFERLEVKDVLAYLQLVDNPAFGPAFARIINVPGRGIGEKTLSDITKRAEESGKTQLELIEGIYDTKIPDQKPSIRKKIVSFVQVIRTLRDDANEGMGPSQLLCKLVDFVQYEEHLTKTQQDAPLRWENVRELISFAREVEEQVAMDKEKERLDRTTGDQDIGLDENVSPLRKFLQASMLSSEGDNDTEEDETNKVTISTCHSAKGLEWPVVIIPSVDSTTYPFIRSEDEDEERRLLYVACTRAKSMLYVTRTVKRMAGGKTNSKVLSPFITGTLEKCQKEGKRSFFIEHLPYLEAEEREVICKVLGRPVPDQAEVERMMDEFFKLGRDVPPNIIWRPSGAGVPPPVTSYHYPPQNAGPMFNEPVQSDGTMNGLVNVVTNGLTNGFQNPRLLNTGAMGPPNAVAGSSTFPGHLRQPISLLNSGPPPRNYFGGLVGSSIQVQNALSRDLPYHAVNPAVRPSLDVSSHPRHPNFSPSKPPVRSGAAEPTLSTNAPPHSTVNARITQASPLSQPPRVSYTPPSHATTSTSRSSGAVSSPLQQVQRPTPSRPQPTPVVPLQMVSNQHLPANNSIQSPAPKVTNVEASSPPPPPAPPVVGIKRGRLGVGRSTTGYSNKKFKPPLAS